jgi:hypothetical protein
VFRLCQFALLIQVVATQTEPETETEVGSEYSLSYRWTRYLPRSDDGGHRLVIIWLETLPMSTSYIMSSAQFSTPNKQAVLYVCKNVSRSFLCKTKSVPQSGIEPETLRSSVLRSPN